ncbi:uncharacterized protein LOC133547554 isoform X5 [Nerophis ophidion]|uniref:uncharacterized protein LOC133547554 isoform X5 n=1 Tax=Nerophis ophidion TaxID=159077 RepID=UPI002ADF2B5A|nr:uncharacterized protein LOC133547554 isoform X5 [Nerophis ophidion]
MESQKAGGYLHVLDRKGSPSFFSQESVVCPATTAPSRQQIWRAVQKEATRKLRQDKEASRRDKGEEIGASTLDECQGDGAFLPSRRK